MFFNKYNVSPMLLAGLLAETVYTPDIAQLEARQFTRVFLPDDAQRTHPQYELIREHSAYVCTGFTSTSFRLYRRKTDGIAVAMEDTSQDKVKFFPQGPCKIKGEIHLVQADGILKLDNHRQNGVQFLRKRIPIIFPHRKLKWIRGPEDMHDVEQSDIRHYEHIPDRRIGKTKELVSLVRCEMYIGIPEYWNKLIDGGFAFEEAEIFQPKAFRSWLPKYYQFLKK